MPELPEVEAWVRALNDPVAAFPVERAGPAHVATLVMIAASALCGGLALWSWFFGLPEMYLTWAFLALLGAILWLTYLGERRERGQDGG